MPYIKSIPENSNPGTIFRQFPESGMLVAELTEKLLRDSTALTVAQRELIAAYVSGLNGCNYCYTAHNVIAEELGTAQGLTDSLIEDIESASIDENMKPILRFVKKLTETPSKMTQADADSIFAAGWDEETYYYIVSICGLFNYYNRLIDGYGIEPRAESVTTLGKFLAEKGYLGAVSGGK